MWMPFTQQALPFLPQNSTEGKKHYQKYLSKYTQNNGMQFVKTRTCFIHSSKTSVAQYVLFCTSLPISSIEIQLYGSVGLGQFIVHGYFRQDTKSSSVGIQYHQELWRIAYRQEIHLLICCQSESNFSKKYLKKYSNYFSCSKMFAP